MSVYAVDKLMAETRRLAAEYYRATQQTLPVSSELAKYDVSQLLKLQPLEQTESGIDGLDKNGLRIHIKSRVIFKEQYGGYRIGQLNQQAPWDRLVLLLMDDRYEPFELYHASREVIDEALGDVNEKRQKRGAMSVAKFIAIGELVWTCSAGFEPGMDYV